MDLAYKSPVKRYIGIVSEEVSNVKPKVRGHINKQTLILN